MRLRAIIDGLARAGAGASRFADRPTRGRVRTTRLALAILVSLAASPAIASAAAGQISVGPILTLAHVPDPGNPGAVTIDGGTMWVDSSSANFDRPFDGFSDVFAYDLRTGQLLSRHPNP